MGGSTILDTEIWKDLHKDLNERKEKVWKICGKKIFQKKGWKYKCPEISVCLAFWKNSNEVCNLN